MPEPEAKIRRKAGDVSVERRVAAFPDHGLELRKDEKGADVIWCAICCVSIPTTRGPHALKDHCEGYPIKAEDVAKMRPCDVYKLSDRTGKDQYRRVTPHVLRFHSFCFTVGFGEIKL